MTAEPAPGADGAAADVVVVEGAVVPVGLAARVAAVLAGHPWLVAEALGVWLAGGPVAREPRLQELFAGDRRHLAAGLAPALREAYAAWEPHTPELSSLLTARDRAVLRGWSRGLSDSVQARELRVSVALLEMSGRALLVRMRAASRAHAVAVAYRAGVLW